jgi:hypothetical protein
MAPGENRRKRIWALRLIMRTRIRRKERSNAAFQRNLFNGAPVRISGWRRSVATKGLNVRKPYIQEQRKIETRNAATAMKSAGAAVNSIEVGVLIVVAPALKDPLAALEQPIADARCV